MTEPRAEAPSLLEQRNALAVAIARSVRDGHEIPEWAIEDFAATDSLVRNHPGAAFGL